MQWELTSFKKKTCHIVLQKSETWLNFCSVFEVSSRNALHWKTTCDFSSRLVCTMKTVTLWSSLINVSFKHNFPEVWNHYTAWYYKLLCTVFDKTLSHLVPETTCPDQSSFFLVDIKHLLERQQIIIYQGDDFLPFFILYLSKLNIFSTMVVAENKLFKDATFRSWKMWCGCITISVI